MPYALIYPMFATVALTYVVGFVTLLTRIGAVRSGSMDARYFKTYSTGTPPEAVLKTGRHFSNLFEIPVLFYAGALAAMMTGADPFWTQTWAWAFVAARVLHAIIHMGSNRIYPRMFTFLLGFHFVMALWICVLLKTLRS